MIRRTVSAVAALLISSACVNAGIIGWQAADDGDGGIVCEPKAWSAPSGQAVGATTIWMTGDLNFAPAHIVGSVATDTPTDPTVTLRSTVENSTFAAWTTFKVNISMNQLFSIANAAVNAPAGWTTNVVPPVFAGTNYVGEITYTAGTPVAIGSSIDFQYDVSFIGNMSFTQEFIPSPVPEPASLGLLGLAGAVALRRRQR